MTPGSADRSRLRIGRLLAAVGALLVAAPPLAGAQPPLFAFAQFSDVQANTQVEFDHFDLVLEAIDSAGQPGALLPQPVAFVLIAGDHVVDPRSEAEWIQYEQTIASDLTGHGIPFLAVPGNHDQDEFGTPLYAQYVAPPGVWDVSSAQVRGQNGLVAATGWAGLRFVGVNNSWAGFNTVRPADLAQVGAIVPASAGAGENVILVTHHPHDDEGVVPLASVLETPGLVGYVRGHKGTPHATQGLVGVANPVWDLSSESVMRDAALIYYEVFQTEIRAYVLKLADGPVALPPPAVIALPHPLWPASPASPVVAFTEAPNAGRAPREVAFADLSSNDPTSWLWDFGDGNTSTERHPVHVYAQGGSYDVSLVAGNAQGGDAQTHVAEVQLLPPLPSVTFPVIADARVSSGSPGQNFGSASTIRARLASATTDQSYLRFSVSGLGDQQVVGAVLRVFVTDPSVDGGQVTAAQGGWDEATITWDNAPGIGTSVLDAKGTVFPDTWVEFDVGGLVSGDGSYDFGLSSGSSNSVFYSSREGASPAELVVFTAPAVPSLDAPGMAALAGLLVALGSRALSRRAAR